MISVYNNIVIVGNAGKDAQIKTTRNGVNITEFSLGCWQGKDKPTMWLMCKSFEPVQINIQKGNKLRVEGRLYFETYKDKDGNERTVWGVMVDNVGYFEAAPKEEAAW